MSPITLRCYRSSAVQPPFVFYILAKGDNAGKPDLQPWPNSFVAIAPNQEMKEFYFWLTFGLHKANDPIKKLALQISDYTIQIVFLSLLILYLLHEQRAIA